ncbi:cysteine hydrolase family protein [Shinella sp.]|uniref:cysteine hydrolase family protein n=1 Tax=Shinella sp. TaxID=1870904 RepID=UPI0039E3DC15
MHKVVTPAWMATRAPYYRFDSVAPTGTAVLSIDMQVVFVDPGQPFAMRHSSEVAENSNRIASELRAVGGVVAFTRHTVSDEPSRAVTAPYQLEAPNNVVAARLLRSGTVEHEISALMDVHPEDVVVDKYRRSAFFPRSSDLDERLRARGVDTVIVTGEATNVCCESTARDAYTLGYRVFFISDATATYTDEEHNATLANLGSWADVRDTESMIDLIKG